MLFTICILGASSYETRRANGTALILVEAIKTMKVKGTLPLHQIKSKQFPFVQTLTLQLMCVFHNCQVAKDLVDRCPCLFAFEEQNVLHFEHSLMKSKVFFIKKNLKKKEMCP